MRDEEIHCYVFTVDIFINFVSDGLWHYTAVQVRIVLKQDNILIIIYYFIDLLFNNYIIMLE